MEEGSYVQVYQHRVDSEENSEEFKLTAVRPGESAPIAMPTSDNSSLEAVSPLPIHEKKAEPEPVAALESLSLQSTAEIKTITVEIADSELFHGVPVGRLYEEYSSKEFRDLESYMLGLESSTKWHSLGSLEGVEGFRLSRSKFSSEIPVVRYVIHFSPPIPSEFVLNMFGDPSYRTSWDSRVLQMNKLYVSEENYFVHYHIVHFNAPLQDRDFLTRYYMRKVGRETRVVLRSTKHKVGAM